jgi:hypothetical protein
MALGHRLERKGEITTARGWGGEKKIPTAFQT